MATDFALEFIRVSHDAIATKHWPAIKESLEGLGFGTPEQRVSTATTEILESTLNDIERQVSETLAVCSDETVPPPTDCKADAHSLLYMVFRIDRTLAKLLDSMRTMDEQRLATKRSVGDSANTPLRAIMELSEALAAFAGPVSAMTAHLAPSRPRDSRPS